MLIEGHAHSVYQESLSAEVMTDNTSFSGRGYTTYGFEVRVFLSGRSKSSARTVVASTIHSSSSLCSLTLLAVTDLLRALQYDPGPDGSIRWAINGSSTWTVHSSAIGPDAAAGIGQRIISEEPMSIVLNLAISFAFQEPEWYVRSTSLSFLPSKLTSRLSRNAGASSSFRRVYL